MAVKGARILAVLWAAVAVSRAQVAMDPSPSSPELYTVEDRGARSGQSVVLSLHRLNYAIQGEDDFKLQYSFKYRVLDGGHLFFAFTNTMVWETLEESIPMKDSVFNPEVFYRFKEDQSWFVTFDTGYSHQSNGQPDVTSRAVDSLFARFHKAGKWAHMPWYASLQTSWNIYQEQRDYDRFLGWWEGTLWFRNILNQRRSGLDLQLQRTAGKGGHPFQGGNTTVGLQYKMVSWERFNPILYVQWFHGYGEVLLDYNRFSDQVRAGISWFY